MNDHIDGHCDPKFQALADVFAENFKSRGEHGASCAMYVEGEKVVDIWGGHSDFIKQKPWQEDTLSIVFSCTKAAVALCAHILIDRGQLRLDDLVCSYWPEFRQNGKESITVRMLLSHQSGLPALRAPIKPGGYYDFDYMAKRLAKEKPFWDIHEPDDTQNGYHLITYGWTVGELIRRVSGKSLGQFFKDEIADPLGVDFHIGLEDKDFDRMAKVIPYVPGPDDLRTDFAKTLMTNPMSIQFLALMNAGGHLPDLPAAWRAEIGGGGGAGNARALAKMFAPLSGNSAFLSQERIEDMRQVSVRSDKDLTMLIPTVFGQGFMLSHDNRAALPGEGNSAIIGSQAFGHVGMGGSIGFADRESGFSFGYTMTKMGGGILLNDRGQSLVDAAYTSMGYSQIRDGAWQL